MVDKLLAEDKAYKCYASKELLDETTATTTIAYTQNDTMESFLYKFI